jgi:hypothetical protein
MSYIILARRCSYLNSTKVCQRNIAKAERGIGREAWGCRGGWLRTFAKDSLDVDVSADIGAVAILEDIIAGKQFQSRREMSVVVQIGRR